MPSFPIIDTHLHVWDTSNLRYPWLDGVPMLNKPFLLDDYNDSTSGISIEKMVFVQCECSFEQCEQEVAWVTKLAASDKRLQGIVAWAPLELGREVKFMLNRYKQNHLVKGIRRIIQFEEDPDFCLRPVFIEGVRILSEYGFSFDICVSHGQLEKVIALVNACPDVSFVLDHIGKPGIKDHLLEPWRSHIAELSTFNNVYCKISGLVTEADHTQWKKDDLTDYVNCVIEHFTPDRLMFGGDWPVLTRAASFIQWMDVIDNVLSGLSHEALVKIFRNNAEQFYRLN